MKNNNIIVSGSMIYDRIMDFPGKFADHIMPDKIHKLSVAFVTNESKINFGGTAGNISYNLKKLGLEPMIFSQAGELDWHDYRLWLGKNKIKSDNIRIIKKKNTSTAYIVTDKDDNQITALDLSTMGVASGIKESVIRKIKNISMAIVSPGNVEDMVGMARVCKKLGIDYIADPGQQIPALTKNNLRLLINDAKYLIVNDYELDLVMQKMNVRSMNSLQKYIDVVVVTKGAKGSIIYTKEKQIKIKAIKPKKIVDPTGAGDAYRAGFIKGLLEWSDLKKAGELASKTAKYAIEEYGTQRHRVVIGK